MLRLLLALLCSFLLVLPDPGAAAAAPSSRKVTGELGRSSVVITAQTVRQQAAKTRRTVKRSTSAPRKRPTRRTSRQVRRVNADPGCVALAFGDPARCLSLDTAPPSAFAGSSAGWSATDVQRVGLPPGELVVEPPGGYAIAGLPVNVYAVQSGPAEIPTRVAGVPVVVRVRPVAWSWSFGDGAVVGPSADPGAAYPVLTHTHTYEAVGSYEIVMTTVYSAQMSVSGGPFEDLEGQVSVPGPPVRMQILTGRPELRAE